MSRGFERLPRVAIIGAGSSGIAVAKALWDRGVPFDCFEASDRIGGNWVFQNKNGMSSAYRSLHINTSRERMQYADFPMPADYPDFPHHALIARYFEAYVDHFGFRGRIRFETTVTRAERLDDLWRLTLGDGTQHFYDVLVVANGHHWDPQGPTPPLAGRFDGITFHSHHYLDPRTPHDLIGKRVVVLGMGNSAMDIACELGHPGVAERVYLSARRGAHVIPKYLFGKPLDQSVVLPTWVPWSIRAAVGRKMFELSVGKMSAYGLPDPEHDIFAAHPTVSSDLFIRVGSGDILPRPGIRELQGDRIEFTDGTVEAVDALILCTGYRVTFPFFDPTFLAAPGNRLPLYRRAFRPGDATLFFVGLCQPLGAIMPIAERQAQWLGDVLLGACALPSAAEMQAWIEAEEQRMQARYLPSPRHTMQVDFDEFMDELAKDMARGRRRSTGKLPVPARAHLRDRDAG